MQTQLKSSLATSLEEIRNATDGEWLIRQLREALELSVSHVIRVAAIVRRLEELDIPVTIKFEPLPFLRKIAYGNMSAELYVKFQGHRLLLDKVGSLPTPDQERLAAHGAAVKVMDLSGDFRQVPVESLTNFEINQVFGTGRLRDDAEQVGFLRERLQRNRPIEQSEEPVVKIDRKRKGIVAGNAFVSLIELKHYVNELSKKR